MEFPWVLPRLATPGSDPFPFLPCCLQGPLADASAVRTDPNVDLLASSAGWVPYPPKEVIAATLLLGVDRYVEGIPIQPVLCLEPASNDLSSESERDN